MAEQIAHKSTADDWRRIIAGGKSFAGRLRAACGFLSALAAVSILTAPPDLFAESVASKNREGNQLFAQGKYEEAEKAYLEAQVKIPGKPEVLYNLGNSLIKQKKFTQGIQSLRQSIDAGGSEIKENSWFNTGNALYSMGNFRESAEAFIQALKLNPGDSDAKHNLELALTKLKQQQKKQDPNQKKQDQENSNQGQASPDKQDSRRQEQNKKADSGSSTGKQQQQSPSAQDAQRAGSISKEQANQILDAVQNQELEQQRKLIESRTRVRTNEKDW